MYSNLRPSSRCFCARANLYRSNEKNKVKAKVRKNGTGKVKSQAKAIDNHALPIICDFSPTHDEQVSDLIDEFAPTNALLPASFPINFNIHYILYPAEIGANLSTRFDSQLFSLCDPISLAMVKAGENAHHWGNVHGVVGQSPSKTIRSEIGSENDCNFKSRTL